jgi:hypothetical protein
VLKNILKASALFSELVELGLCSSDDDIVSFSSCFNIDLCSLDVLNGRTLCVNLLFAIFHDFETDLIRSDIFNHDNLQENLSIIRAKD